MTDASTAAPNTNAPNAPNARHARRQRPDLAEQLQQLKAGAGDGTAAPEAQQAPQQQQQRPPREKKPRPQGQQPHQQQARKPQAQQQQPQQPQRAPRKVNPVLERLFELYPQLFGARFVPLKLGVYEELLARHPEDFKPEDLKIAMGQHARSTRYLEAVAAGLARHDLDGNALDAVAPEHVHHAILELHRRRAHRAPGEDLRPQLVSRIAKAIEASGLDREAYAVLVRSRDANANAVVDEALAELAQQAAKREALLRAFEASGRSEQEFADMYGMKPGEVARTLQRARAERQAPVVAAASADAAPADASAVDASAADTSAAAADAPASDAPAAAATHAGE